MHGCKDPLDQKENTRDASSLKHQFSLIMFIYFSVCLVLRIWWQMQLMLQFIVHTCLHYNVSKGPLWLWMLRLETQRTMHFSSQSPLRQTKTLILIPIHGLVLLPFVLLKSPVTRDQRPKTVWGSLYTKVSFYSLHQYMKQETQARVTLGPNKK